MTTKEANHRDASIRRLGRRQPVKTEIWAAALNPSRLADGDVCDRAYSKTQLAIKLPGARAASIPNCVQSDQEQQYSVKSGGAGTAGDALAPARSQPSGPAFANQRGQRTPLRPGMMFHQYQLIRELGRGGMGAVYLARHTRLGRRVAIKFLASEDKDLAARFLSEARTTARCEHDNIVGIYHADEAHGYSYLVLEYLEGVNLYEWMQKRWHRHESGQDEQQGASIRASPEESTALDRDARVSPTLAVELMLPVVRALAHAHQLGLVHRDLKPENIMLTDEGAIKVLDFGIAKVLDQQRRTLPIDESIAEGWTEHQVATRHSTILGTMPYMSPEQWRRDELDARSDIWAVGIMLWELCTGRHPLDPLSRVRLLAVSDIDEPMPSLAAERPDLGPLAEIIDYCLAKDKAKRMPSAGALIAALEPLLPNLGSTAVATAVAPGAPDNPYVGLAAFQERDAGRFFGRDREIAGMVGQLRNRRLVAVVGASGAGKSSFVRAGVIPALARSGQRWESFIVRPGRQPLAGLAGIVAQIADSASDRAGPASAVARRAAHSDALRAEPGGLGTMLRDRCHRHGTRILLVVDQFEELYTLGADRDTREAFVRCLEGVADDASAPLRVLLLVRSDFLDRVAEDRAFMSEITRGLWFLPPMQRDQLHQALLRPLQAAGYRLENQDRLLEIMLDGLADTRAPLPLLQFAAARLWELRDREQTCISQASYEQLGGVAGALVAHADTVMAGLSQREQYWARTVFTSLVTDERTRAIVSLDELRAMAPKGAGEAMERLVHHLAEVRLLLLETDAAADVGRDKNGTTVEISHESLIDNWPQLSQWLTADQEESAFRAQLRTAARQWHKHGRSEDLLWRGQAAGNAQRWLDRWCDRDRSARGPSENCAKTSGLGLDYLHAVVALAARARQRRRRAITAAFALVSLVAVVVSALAVHASRLADRAASQAEKIAEKAVLVAAESVQARNAGRMASAREYQSIQTPDPTMVLALVREMEPAAKLPSRWRDLARWAMYQGVAKAVFTHQASVTAAAFSPDGTRIVTASEDHTAQVWNIDGTGMPAFLQGHLDVVQAVSFSPDGKRIVTASYDKTARVWNVDGTGTPLILRGHRDVVYSAAFSPDGKRIVTASWDRTARVWNADGTGTPLVLQGHRDALGAAAFSPDGTRIVTASADRTVRVWNADGTGTPLVLQGHRDHIYSAAFSPDGTRIVTASADKTARVWNADGSGVPLVLQGHQDHVYWAVFSPDGTRIVTASVDRRVRVWNADGIGAPWVLQGHQDVVNTASFSPDGTHIVTASADKTARIWNTRPTTMPLILQGHQEAITQVAFNRQGTRIVTASLDGTARVWNADGTGSPLILEGHDDDIWEAAFSPDGKRIVTASRDQTARIWNANGTGKPVILQGHQDHIYSVAFSPDSNRIVTASADHTARVWNADGTGTPLVLRGHEDMVGVAVFSPDGSRIATVSADHTARVWNADGTGTPVILRGHRDTIYAVSFSPDGSRIVTASRDTTARVWNPDGTGTPLILRGHQDAIYAVAFSRDGSRIVTASADHTARVWNADGTGVPVILQGHQNTVTIAAFAPDDNRVVTIAGDQTIRVWNTDGTGEPLILRVPNLDIEAVAFSPDSTRIVSASHRERMASTGDTRHVAKLWTNIQRFAGLDDPKLWSATKYCPSIELRIELLGVSKSRAKHDYDRCNRRVAAANPRDFVPANTGEAPGPRTIPKSARNSSPSTFVRARRFAEVAPQIAPQGT